MAALVEPRLPQHGEHRAPLGREAHVGRGRAGELLGRVLGTRHGGRQPAADLGVGLGRHGREQLVAVGEVPIRSAHAHPARRLASASEP